MKPCLLLLVASWGLTCQPAATPESAPPPELGPPRAEAPPEDATGSESATTEPSAEPSAEPSVEPEVAAPAEPPTIEVGEPKFLGEGTVPDVEEFLEKMKKATAECLVEHAEGEVRGSMRIQFLVRLSGRAEGVDVQSAKGVSQAAQRCVRDAFKHKQVGTPTVDPTGVSFTYTFE